MRGYFKHATDKLDIRKDVAFESRVVSCEWDKETNKWTVKTEDGRYPEVPAPYHFAYGAGARMCTAVNFSNRLLYTVFVRTILSFHIKEGKEVPCDTDRITYKADPAASNAISKPFTVRYVPRDEGKLDAMLAEASQRLSEFVTGDNTESLVVG